MSIPPPDWLYEDRARTRRRRFRLRALLTLAVLGGGGWWLGAASPWAPAVQAAVADTPLGQGLASTRAAWEASPVAHLVSDVVAFADAGQRLAHRAPAESTFYAELAPSWWHRLVTWGPAMRPTGEALAPMRRFAHDQLGLDWDRDLAPWLDPDVGVIGMPDGAWSLWAASRDATAADAFLDRLAQTRADAGDAVAPAEHGGTRYIVVTPAEGGAYAVGRLGGYVVMAAPPASFATWLDREAAGGPSLTDAPRFRRVAAELAHGAVGRMWIDLAARRVDPLSETSPGAPRAEAAGAAIVAERDGVTFSTVTAFDVAHAAPEAVARARAVMPPLDMARFDRLPEATVVAVGGTAGPDTGKWLSGPVGWLWAPLGGGLGPGWAFSTLLAHLEEARGPFAAGLVAADPDAGSADPVGAVVSLRPDDPAALAAALTREGGRLTEATDLKRLGGPLAAWPWLGGLLPKATELVDEPHGRETWKVLKAAGQPLAGWTVSGPEVVLAGGGEALRLAEGDGFRSLTRRASFQVVRRRLPGAPGAFAYADGRNVARLLESSPILPARYAHRAGRALTGLEAVGCALEPGLDARGFHHAALTVLAGPGAGEKP